MSVCQQDKLAKDCPCTYPSCSRRGKCCECIAYHRKNDEAPACLFPPDVEKTYDRRLTRLAECYR